MNLKLETIKAKIFTRLFLFFLGLIYVFLLHITYVNIISLKWSYLGYIYNDPPPISIIFAWLTAIIPLLWLPINLTRPSQFTYWFLYLVVIVPSSIIPVYLFNPKSYILADITWPILLSFFIIGMIYKLPLIRFPRIRMRNTTFWLIITLPIIIFYSLFFHYFGFRLRFSSLISSEIYIKRLEARQIIAQIGKIFGYIVIWLAKIINPFLIAVGLTFGKWMLVFLGIFGQLLGYSAEASKTTLLSPFMLIGLFILLKKQRKRFGLLIILLTIGLILSCFLLDKAFVPDTSPLMSILVRRMIITPGLLTSYYFDFFSENPKAKLGHSILRGLVDYPYSADPPFVIGDYYFNNPSTSANANFFADAFANFGYPGIFVFAIILALILWLFDCLSKSLPLQFSVLMFALPSFALSNSALLTSLLTHGILGIIFLMWLLPRKPGMMGEK